jgi:phosphonate transport system substrate-binding protein
MRPMSAKLRIATFLAPNMLPVYEFVVDAIGRELGSGAELVVGGSFDQFRAGEIDAGFICGLPYVQLARQRPAPVELLAAPVICGDRYAGRPIYFSDVIVHRDSPVRTFADLRGRSWA